jgi:hypothetical protein
VGAVANGQGIAPQASPDCVIHCTERLRQITEKGKILLDQGGCILGEYQRVLAPAGQPGPGHAFLKWVFTNLWNPARCELVPITPDPDAGRGFLEFPSDPDLARFDPDDRVFVAVACAHTLHPPILNAVDTDWWLFQDALARNGVHVEFLCPRDVEEIIRRRNLAT